MSLNSPMTQVYLNNNQVDTIFCINNFYSFLCPELKELSYELRIGFTNHKGIMICKEHFSIKRKNSIFLSIKGIFHNNNIKSELGLIMANIYPTGDDNVKNDLFKKMGKITSYFYNFYEGLQSNSLSIVRPQSVIDGKKYGASWRSNQIINCSNLKELRIIQPNQSDESQMVNFSIFDTKNKNILSTKFKKIDAYGVKMIVFSKNEIGNENIGLAMDKLPTGNGKPLIMRIFNGGEFNVSRG